MNAVLYKQLHHSTTNDLKAAITEAWWKTSKATVVKYPNPWLMESLPYQTSEDCMKVLIDFIDSITEIFTPQMPVGESSRVFSQFHTTMGHPLYIHGK